MNSVITFLSLHASIRPHDDPASRESPLSSLNAIDRIVIICVLALGILQFTGYVRAPGELADARYSELTRSILETGSYQFNFRPETLMPPGLPLILALICRAVGYTQAVLFHVMSISTTLALLASYALLRRTAGRTVAAAACLLLVSSPALFSFATQIIFSDMPYFCASMLALLLALKMDRAQPSHARIGWMLLFSISMVLALMIRSAGIALVAGLSIWILASFLADRSLGRRRLKLFLFPLLLALSAQVLWTEWAGLRQFSEWALPGYPGSYITQLKVKSGNDPELGPAHLKDLPERVEQNLVTRTAELVKLLSRKEWVNPFWCSPLIFGILAPILIGLASSLRKNGGQLHDWYFAGYELMYALWPWNFEMRFLLPIVPLACLYFWRGIKAIGSFSRRQPGIAGWTFLLVGVVLTFTSANWAAHTRLGQALGATGFWAVFTLVGCGMLILRSFDASPHAQRVLAVSTFQPGGRFLPLLRLAALLVLGALAGKGVAMQVRIAHSNMTYDMTRAIFYPDIEAAQWIRTHESPGVVVMARKQDLVYHYSNHMVIWFPPISDPQVLMGGIRKHHIGLVVVTDRDDGYFVPRQEDCFQPLFRNYSQAFQLVHHGPDNWVFEIRPQLTAREPSTELSRVAR
jgi:hypothetical protein